VKLLCFLAVLLTSSVSIALEHPPLSNLATHESENLEAYTKGGKWLIVMIWASDCIACNNEARSYSELHTRHKNGNARVLGLSVDGDLKRDEAIAFTKRHEISFPNLIASPDVVARYYSELTSTAWVGTPSFLIFNPEGSLEAKQAGAIPADLLEQFLDQYASN
jgi:peroxiredoxin